MKINYDAPIEDGKRRMMISVYCEETKTHADFRIPVAYNDSLSAMQKDAKAELRVFLNKMLEGLNY